MTRAREPNGHAREPPLSTAVVLHVPIALPLPDAAQAQIELLDVLVVGDRLRVAVEHDTAVLHHVAVLRVLQGDGGVLLGEQHGHALLAVEPAHDVEDLGHQHRGEAHRRLVEQHQRRPRHQRAADGEHLLLAARDVAGGHRAPVRQAGEIAVDADRGAAVSPARAPARVGAGQEVLLDREVLEDVPALHHLHDALPHHLVRRMADGSRVALELDRCPW